MNHTIGTPYVRSARFFPLTVTVVALTMALAGCQGGPKVAEMGDTVTAGKMQVSVTGYDVRRLQLVDGKRTHEYEDPVLAIKVTLTNKGKKPFRYSPTHSAQQMSEATTPLLYSDPGKEAELPPSSKSPINGVVLKQGHPSDQITKSTMIKPGTSISDIMLFEVPEDKQADLIFSLPPSIHRGEMPLLFRVPYEYKQPTGPTVHSVGDAIKIDGVTFTVESAKLAYIETEHPKDGKGFSSEPLLKVTYQITNNRDKAVTYTPGHRAVSGRRAGSLRAGDKSFARVRFSSNTDILGQLSEATEIAPSKSVTDFSIFEAPGEGVDSMLFEYPASRFGGEGLVRVDIPYEADKPDLPEPLEKDEKKEKED